ncbi:hypothetical protein [Leisingera sp. ANG-DT]|uniref:hypothetical protein n=1 Tax=Leisingera sp. ANG-DT TaxID=1577897 RepID=UPI001F4CDC67|nr:hypothetical protein [Leisingera sp. ANG-DT]
MAAEIRLQTNIRWNDDKFACLDFSAGSASVKKTLTPLQQVANTDFAADKFQVPQICVQNLMQQPAMPARQDFPGKGKGRQSLRNNNQLVLCAGHATVPQVVPCRPRQAAFYTYRKLMKVSDPIAISLIGSR